ncbi:CoA-binding protein [Candidatus Riflebacteria bacterium]
MSIIIDETKRVMVQGITGREGMARTKLMLGYGTKVVAGCTPGKGGQEVLGVPVFDTVAEAVENIGQIDISVIFVPGPLVKNAAIEAIYAGVKFCVLVPDRVPVHDVLEVVEVANRKGAAFLGPNTLGILSPSKAVLGMMGGRAESARRWFKPGPVGITSRSGGITSSIAYYLNRVGIGQTTICHVGGDPVIGMAHPQMVLEFEKDPDTKLVVMFGEIGTSQEESVADLIEQKKFSKPLVAYVGGRGATKGTRFSHAGAIVEGNRGSYEGKVSRLKEAGAHVVENFQDIPDVTGKILREMGEL